MTPAETSVAFIAYIEALMGFELHNRHTYDALMNCLPEWFRCCCDMSIAARGTELHAILIHKMTVISALLNLMEDNNHERVCKLVTELQMLEHY